MTREEAKQSIVAAVKSIRKDDWKRNRSTKEFQQGLVAGMVRAYRLAGVIEKDDNLRKELDKELFEKYETWM